jgi:hypothetical protein
MYVSWETIITVGAVVSAIVLIVGLLSRGHKWILNQDQQSKDISDLRQHHEEDVRKIKEENCMMCEALSACLDGLMQLGCNHTVPDTKLKLDKYLNRQAHE